MQPAVFAKNHETHLAAAADVAAANPDQWVTFRSSRRWASASRLLDELGPGVVPVLFAVVDGGPEVWYRAWLQEVVLGPTEESERTRLLLDLRPPTTQHEDLLEENPKTLFAISGCTRLNRALPYATLIKRDGEPLSDTFGYSYALVQLSDGEAGTAVAAATDIAAPPPRHNAVVSRVIRDTRLTRRLKALHDDVCQLCETRLELPDGRSYSEAHHLRPLGRPHDGPDIPENVIVLCPNCHALCDLSAMHLVPADLAKRDGHKVAPSSIEYHNQLASSKKRSAKRE